VGILVPLVKSKFCNKLITNNQTCLLRRSLGTIPIILWKIEGADLTFAISYDSDIKKVEDLILSDNNPKVLQTPKPEFCKKTDSTNELAVRPGQTVQIWVLH
jgi:small conductance mechanosensitive channel